MADSLSWRECSKKHALSLPEGFVQQGRSLWRRLAAFFNIPKKEERWAENVLREVP